MAPSKNAQTENNEAPRTRYFVLIMLLAAVLGVVGGIIVINILSEVVDPGDYKRIPKAAVVLPLLLALAGARMLDAYLIRTKPHLVRKKDRTALAARLGHDPATGQPAPAGSGQAPATTTASGAPATQPGYGVVPPRAQA